MNLDPMYRWRLTGLIASVVIVLTIPVYAVRELADRRQQSTTEDAPVVFVGRDACVDCHEEAYASWLGSDHDRAMDVANDSTVLGDFDDSVFESDKTTARFYRRDGKFYVFTEGPEGAPGEFEITHTFGFEPLQQYLIPFPGGRLQSLTIAWDTERDRWFDLYPDQDIPTDDWLHWTRNAQNWNGMCAECHSTNLKKGYDVDTKTFATTWSEIDVSCEACHGPGSRHVAWAEIPPMARPQTENYGLVIATADMDSEQQVELCAPCHSRRTELGDYDHTQADLLQHLVPSLLRENLYHHDGQILEEVYVYGSFQQSKMYRNGVRCSDCHDAHSLQLLSDGNELCLQCHQADVYDSYDHHFHQKVYEGEPSDGASCVKCHMPEQPYMVIDYRADHSLRVPRPDLTLEIGVPNACSQTGCHDDQSVQWSAEHYQEWYGRAKRAHFGPTFAAARDGRSEAEAELIRVSGDPLHPAIVRATALSLLASYPGATSAAALRRALGDEAALVRYTALDAVTAVSAQELIDLAAPLLFDPVKAVRLEAATRLAGAPTEMLKPYQRDALQEALAEYEAAMEYSLDFAFAGHNLGNLYVNLQQPERAERYYRVAIEIDDLFYPAKMNLAMLYNSMGRNEAARALLSEVVNDFPELYDAAYSLALLLVEMEQLQDAAVHLRRAAEGLPQRSRIHYNLGLLEQNLGNTAAAEAALMRALALEPESLDYQFALADHYVRRGNLTQALQLADRMISTHPESELGSQMKARVEAMLGR
ncbi:MAG: tetratricopeptide repeat protein [Gemmatimonadota bacterium]|nr:MAG: tetratricopeptide repeat protein [Gemmatimonadota bacterium]